MTADRLEELRQQAHNESPAVAILALDNVARLAVLELRKLEQGADVIPIRRKSGSSMTRLHWNEFAPPDHGDEPGDF